MAELEKIKRSLAKHDPHAPHERLLVVDATTGSNALNSSAGVSCRSRSHRPYRDQARRQWKRWRGYCNSARARNPDSLRREGGEKLEDIASFRQPNIC